MKLNYGTLVLALIGLGLFAWRASSLPRTPYRVAGLAIATPSLLLLIFARVQLGRAFSGQVKASVPVTTGLYARILNPIYVFSSLMIAGIIVWTGRPWLFLALAVIVAVQLYRARKQAAVIEEAFGEEYREYRTRSWVLMANGRG